MPEGNIDISDNGLDESASKEILGSFLTVLWLGRLV